MDPTDWIDLTGKVAHVTGAGQGIGAAIVAVSDQDADGAARTAQRIGGLGMRLDVSDRNDVDATRREVWSRLKPLRS